MLYTYSLPPPRGGKVVTLNPIHWHRNVAGVKNWIGAEAASSLYFCATFLQILFETHWLDLVERQRRGGWRTQSWQFGGFPQCCHVPQWHPPDFWMNKCLSFYKKYKSRTTNFLPPPFCQLLLLMSAAQEIRQIQTTLMMWTTFSSRRKSSAPLFTTLKKQFQNCSQGTQQRCVLWKLYQQIIYTILWKCLFVPFYCCPK